MAKNVISSAKTLLTAYRKALVGLEDGLGEEFAKAVKLMQGIDGHVVAFGTAYRCESQLNLPS